MQLLVAYKYCQDISNHATSPLCTANNSAGWTTAHEYYYVRLRLLHLAASSWKAGQLFCVFFSFLFNLGDCLFYPVTASNQFACATTTNATKPNPTRAPRVARRAGYFPFPIIVTYVAKKIELRKHKCYITYFNRSSKKIYF